VFLFDLDGTLIKEELLPLIGKQVGLFDELRELTRSTMQGEILFEDSFRMRVSMLGEIDVRVVEEIVLSAQKLEKVLGFIKEQGINAFVVTGNLDCWTNAWFKENNLVGFTSTSTFSNDSLSVKDVLVKKSVLAKFSESYVVSVGDGANDVGLFEGSDFSIATEIVHTVPDILLEVSNCVIRDEDTLCRIMSRLS
jgi:phosphoserine phosphatase